jgi:hypothetical protein
VFLQHWQLKPADADDLSSAQIRELCDHTDRVIAEQQRQAAESRSNG